MVEFNINYLFQLINFFILLAVIGLPIYVIVKVIKAVSDINNSNQRIESLLEDINEKLKKKDS